MEVESVVHADPKDRNVSNQSALVDFAKSSSIATPNFTDFHSSRYVAFDLRSRFFSPSQQPGRFQELANLYAEVFNAVEAVPEKWTNENALNMVEARLDKPGCNIVLVDMERGEKQIGAFLSNYIPGPHGWTISEADVLLKQEYRSEGLGREFTWIGESYANADCKKTFGEGLILDHAKTYRKPAFPKRLWGKWGFKMFPLFTQEARRLTRPTPLNTSVDIVESHEIEALARFISSDNSTISSTGETWSYDRAETFVRFMHKHNYSTFRIVRHNEDIIGASVGDIMPGRSAPSLVEAQCFVKSTDHLRSMGIMDITQEDIARQSFFDMFAAARGVAMHRWRQTIVSIDIPEQSAPFFANILPSLQEDEIYLAMTANHQKFTDNMEPPINKRTIAFYPFSPT